MTNTQPTEVPGLADDIVQIVDYAAPLPPKPKKFLPWHRPRKQYVRDHQWCNEILRMIEEAPLANGVLKYLGLPGVDLLDLRHFHEAICETKNVNLRFLGFNSSAKPLSSQHVEMNISLDEVRKLTMIDPMSEMISDGFELISNESSIACRKARDLGPYDVINLDLCDGFGAQAPSTLDNSYYDAIQNLLALQSRSKNPWLLLLTTRTDAPNVNPELLERLLKKYIQNLANCPSFLNASRDEFGIETQVELEEASRTAIGLPSIFLVGLSKWLLGMVLAQQPPTSLRLCSVVGYRVNKEAESEDLISLAFKFTPTFIPAGDPLSIATQRQPPPDECVLSTRALKRVAKRIDADKKLAEDETLLQKMIDSTARLLSLARYDSDSYKEWIKTA